MIGRQAAKRSDWVAVWEEHQNVVASQPHKLVCIHHTPPYLAASITQYVVKGERANVPRRWKQIPTKLHALARYNLGTSLLRGVARVAGCRAQSEDYPVEHRG